jgi:hypothetical protein
MKRATFYTYSDPGHSWVRVPKLILDVYLGEHWRKHFTPFSYEYRQYVYLEEDLDWANFDRRIRDAGIAPVYKQGSCAATRPSRIRNYPPLAPL